MYIIEVYSLHYYDSVLVIEKKPISKPVNSQTGVSLIPNFNRLPIVKRIKMKASRILNNLKIFFKK